MHILQKGIINLDKLLCIDFGMAIENVMEYISSISNALILLITSLMCYCTVEKMQVDTGNTCCATVISVHRRVTELVMGTLCTRSHLTNSTTVLVFCINQVIFRKRF